MNPLQPSIIGTLKIPTDGSPDTETRKVSTRPLAMDVFVEGRVAPQGWADIQRHASDDRGQPVMSTAGVTLNDDDGAFRDAIKADETRFTTETEVKLAVLSEAGRLAELEERALFRGRLERNPEIVIERQGLQRKRRVRLSLIHELATMFDQTIPVELFTRARFKDIHRDLENTRIPLIYAEHSDAGTQDVNSASAEKGLIPLIHVGTATTIDDKVELATPSFIDVPTGLGYSLGGASGSHPRYYGVTALTEDGETVLSDVLEVSNGPATLSATNSIVLTWSPVADATGYIVYGRENVTPVRRIRIITSGATTTFTDTGEYAEHAPAPPEINTARLPLPGGGFYWDLYIACLGVIPITGIYGSDDAKGEPPKRILLNETVGRDFLIAGWDRQPAYLEIDGLWLTYVLGRGPRSYAHWSGTGPTLAISTCGYTDEGDGTGTPISQAGYILQHLLTNFVPDRNGETWTSGAWRSLRTFSDGAEVLQTSMFEAWQDLTKLFLENDIGYLGHRYFREPITVRELIQDFHSTHGSYDRVNHHGQYGIWTYNPYAALTDGRVYREKIEISRLENPVLDETTIEPARKFQYDYDPDADAMRSEVEIASSDLGVANQKLKYKDLGIVQCRFSRDAATVRDAQHRLVQRLKRARWRQGLVSKFRPALESEVSDQILITHPDGGWEDHPFVVVSHVTQPNIGDVRLDGFDVYPLLSAFGDVAAEDAAEDWDSATEEERASLFFVSDDNGLIPGNGSGSELI